jgi:aerobic carbon-monoxide dehydrogenase large subunit
VLGSRTRSPTEYSWRIGSWAISASALLCAARRISASSGQGTYTDDITRPGQLHAFLLRSPHAHAELDAIDTAAAKAAPGVAAVVTGADVQVGGLPCGWLVTSKDGKPMIEPPHPLLAQGKVRHVGDPVAVIAAETLEQAKDAAELIDVSYKTLPAVVTSEAAIKPGSPLLFDTAPVGRATQVWHAANIAKLPELLRKPPNDSASGDGGAK